MNKTQIDEFVQLLQKYELSIAILYETFANIFPSSKKAWMAYAKEERLHAKWINALHAQIKNETISFEQTKFTTQSTRTAIGFIEDRIDRVVKSKPDLQQAIIIAIDIEKSLLESAFLKVFTLRGPKAEKIQSRLVEATKVHKKRLIEWHENLKV